MTLLHRIIAGAILCAGIALCMIGAGIERVGHRCPVCPDCPELVGKSRAIRDSIIVHDTVRVVKYAQSITVRAVPSADTMRRSIVTYEVIDTMPDHAVIGMAVSSGWLPMPIPPDLTHTAWYLAAPERIRIISDTLTVQLPPLKQPARLGREIAIGGICLGVGAITATSVILWRFR